MNGPRPISDSEAMSQEGPLDDEDEVDDVDRIEGSGDIVSVPEADENQRLDQVCLVDDERESENMGLFRVQISAMKLEVIMKEVFSVVLGNVNPNE